MNRIAVLFAVVTLLASACFAQTLTQSNALSEPLPSSQSITLSNGATAYLAVYPGAIQHRIEVSVSGSPTAATLLIYGCGASFTCEFAGIWNSTASGSIPIVGQYNSLKFTASLTAGTSPSITFRSESVPSEVWASQTAYSPTQMNMNAVAEPSSGTTASSAIISLVNVRAMTIMYNCGQAAKLNVLHYAEDGQTLLRTDTVTTGSTASVWAEYELTSGQKNVINDTAGTVAFTLPQNAVAFSLTNNVASVSTCSLRVITQY
jgi:hypothetical protein